MKRFSKEEKIWIEENYKTKSIDEMCNFLNRSKNSLKGFMHSKGFKNNFNYARPNNIGLEDKKLCYLLGFIWADGCVSRQGQLELTILKEDAENICSIIEYVEGFRAKENIRPNRKNTISFISRNKDLISLLLNLGFATKSYDEPTELLEKMPPENHYLFWRGFFDGDGCIYNQKTSDTKVSKRIEISGQFNYEWIELGHILNKLGCSFVVKRQKTRYGNNSIVKIWRKNDIIAFGNYIYQDGGYNGYLARKKIRFY